MDRPWPFDIIPRIIPRDQWQLIEAGLVQRLAALNLFIDDCYHDQRAVSAGVVPADLVTGSPNFRRECVGVDPPGGIWAHICGSDLIRDDQGFWYVLEDNLRVPSGVSYLLENRMVTKHIFPEMFRHYSIEPVDPYVGRLAATLASVSPSTGDPTIVVLTPGIYNSAYFEHAFLAQQLGRGAGRGQRPGGARRRLRLRPHHRRPGAGRRHLPAGRRPLPRPRGVPARLACSGVPGLMRAWKAGRVALVNAPGAGIADDKKVYSYVPDIIRFYLDEEPILWTIPTYRCSDPESRAHVLANLPSLVVKPANESGGYGVLVGSQATDRRAGRGGRGRSRTSPTAGWPSRSSSCRPRRPCATRGSPPATSTCGPFTLIGPGRRLRDPGRAHPGGPAQGLAGRELVPGRRQQGHLGGRRAGRTPASAGRVRRDGRPARRR